MLSPVSFGSFLSCPEAERASCEYEVNVNTAPKADLGAGAFSTFHELTQSWCGNSYFQRTEIKFFLRMCIVISAETKWLLLIEVVNVVTGNCFQFLPIHTVLFIYLFIHLFEDYILIWEYTKYKKKKKSNQT